jgi:inorganic pyrophosphatase
VDVNLLTIPAFAARDTIHVVVESPRGSHLKLKYDPRWEAMGISRPLPVGLVFPFDWGFVPSTQGPDGDPVDAFVMWDVASFPGIVVECRPLGLLRVEQNAMNFDRSRRVRNDRILALPTTARRESGWSNVDDIPERIRDECVQFTIAAAALEGKDVTVLGWSEASDAVTLLGASVLTPATRP